MTNYLSSKEIALKLKISQKKISELCRKKIILGAKKNKGKWVIPNTSTKKIIEILNKNKKNDQFNNFYKKSLIIIFFIVLVFIIIYLNWLLKPTSYQYDIIRENDKYFEIIPIYNYSNQNQVIQKKKIEEYTFYCQIFLYTKTGNAYVRLYNNSSGDIEYETNKFGLAESVKIINKERPTFKIIWPSSIIIDDYIKDMYNKELTIEKVNEDSTAIYLNNTSNFLIAFTWENALKNYDFYQKEFLLQIGKRILPYAEWENDENKYSIHFYIYLPYSYKITHQSTPISQDYISTENINMVEYNIALSNRSNYRSDEEILYSQGNIYIILENINAPNIKSYILLISGILIGIIGNIITHFLLKLYDSKSNKLN